MVEEAPKRKRAERVQAISLKAAVIFFFATVQETFSSGHLSALLNPAVQITNIVSIVKAELSLG